MSVIHSVVRLLNLGEIKNKKSDFSNVFLQKLLYIQQTKQILTRFNNLFIFHPQAAYLVGVSDPNSSAGQKGLVDPAQFARANQSIQMACQNLVDPACTQSQVH